MQETLSLKEENKRVEGASVHRCSLTRRHLGDRQMNERGHTLAAQETYSEGENKVTPRKGLSNRAPTPNVELQTQK